MRVLVDSRMIYMSGIGRYIRNLLMTMARLDADISFELLGRPDDFANFLGSMGEEGQRFRHLEFLPAIYGVKEQALGSIEMLKARRADIVHFPHFNAPRLVPAASVVTVHDLIPLRFSGFHNPWRVKAAAQVMKNAVEKAARIIVVSDAAAADLKAMFPASRIRDKIHRTYLGVSEDFTPLDPAEVEAFKSRHQLGDYILYVGNRLPHKNLGRLARAFISLQNDYPGLQMVVAGNRLRENDEVDQVKRAAGAERIIEWGPADDKQLRALYSGARALVFVSLCEGFGLPALEAMACGTPVVAADNSSLPEVAGEAGIYVNPYEVEDIARGIRQMLDDSDLRNELSRRGFEQAGRFRWEATARQTLAVYREIMGSKS